MILDASANLNLNFLENVMGPRLIQGGFAFGLFLYCLFALVILKQSKMMEETIDGKYNQAVNAFAWMHLIMAVLLFLMSLFYL